jgi:DNA-binding transcriptional LysR family regulator
MVPTERAKLLYAQIAQAVDRLERVDDAFKLPGRAPVLRLGGPPAFTSGSSPRCRNRRTG